MPLPTDQQPLPFKTVDLAEFLNALIEAIQAKRPHEGPNRLVSINTCRITGLVRIVYEKGQGTGKLLHLTYDRNTHTFTDGYAMPQVNTPLTDE